jgi:HD-GYP domain-containing protein (c-di-GMP phosphodiesterase class II)
MQAEERWAGQDDTRALAERVVMGLARAMKNVSFYEVGHPVVRQALAATFSDLQELLGERPSLTIKLISGYLVVQEAPLLSQQASVGNLVGACQRRGVQSMFFEPEVTLEEIEQLVAVLAADPKAIEAAGGAGRALRARGVQRISVERLSAVGAADWRWIHASALDALRSAARQARLGRGIDVGGVKLSVHDIVDDVLGQRSIVYNLNSMKGMDEYTFIHALHLCILSIELGRQIGLTREQLEELGVATLLHDVGKIFVPLEILRKPAALDEAEFATMSRHPVQGAAVLAPERELPEVAPVVAFEHHMHLDHSGYPRTPRPRPIHVYSLMASIVDVYDALTTMRPYRPPLPPHQALQVIREQYQGRLEPRLLAQFLRMLGPYPWGTLLQFSDGRFAVVTRPNLAAPEHPFARFIDASSGQPVVAEEEAPLDGVMAAGRFQIVDPLAVGLDLTGLLHHLQRPRVAEVFPGASPTV